MFGDFLVRAAGYTYKCLSANSLSASCGGKHSSVGKIHLHTVIGIANLDLVRSGALWRPLLRESARSRQEVGRSLEQQPNASRMLCSWAGTSFPVSRPRYRWRTRLRTLVPFFAIDLLPKGNTDCGRHEWYGHDADTFYCYHCTVGILKAHDLPEVKW